MMRLLMKIGFAFTLLALIGIIVFLTLPSSLAPHAMFVQKIAPKFKSEADKEILLDPDFGDAKLSTFEKLYEIVGNPDEVYLPPKDTFAYTIVKSFAGALKVDKTVAAKEDLLEDKDLPKDKAFILDKGEVYPMQVKAVNWFISTSLLVAGIGFGMASLATAFFWWKALPKPKKTT